MLPVAPHTGAWIETRDFWGSGHVGIVAPHTGAWIETIKPICTKTFWNKSLLIQERGLKLDHMLHGYVRRHVAPHTGAWIETIAICIATGLDQVAPHTGAWIETGILRKNVESPRSRSSYRSVD